MQIFIKTLDGRSKTYDVTDDTKIKKIKEMIAETEGIPEKQQRLVYSGKPLEDEQTLSDYNIGPNATIHFVMFLKG